MVYYTISLILITNLRISRRGAYRILEKDLDWCYFRVRLRPTGTVPTDPLPCTLSNPAPPSCRGEFSFLGNSSTGGECPHPRMKAEALEKMSKTVVIAGERSPQNGRQIPPNWGGPDAVGFSGRRPSECATNGQFAINSGVRITNQQFESYQLETRQAISQLLKPQEKLLPQIFS